ncbi:MAG: F0F1 ATP synthase subunit B [Aquificota bacterium]|nr:MAG: F0F1 ATP synthase subunit B [Aquificota bacterium]
MDIQQALYPNATLFIQAVLFLVFVVLVRQLLVKPYTQVIEEREAIIQKNLQEASELRESAKKLLEEASSLLEKGRQESNQILSLAKKEAEKLRLEIISKAEESAQREMERAVQDIRKSLEEEKAKLEAHIREVADLITRKVLEEAA